MIATFIAGFYLAFYSCKLAIERSKSVERVINKGSSEATRCVELASGAERTEEELKATKKSEINTMCPSLANPNFVPYE